MKKISLILLGIISCATLSFAADYKYIDGQKYVSYDNGNSFSKVVEQPQQVIYRTEYVERPVYVQSEPQVIYHQEHRHYSQPTYSGYSNSGYNNYSNNSNRLGSVIIGAAIGGNFGGNSNVRTQNALIGGILAPLLFR